MARTLRLIPEKRTDSIECRGVLQKWHGREVIFEGRVDSADALHGVPFNLTIRLRDEFTTSALELPKDAIGWILMREPEAGVNASIDGAIFCDVYLDHERFAELWLRGMAPIDPDTQLSIGLEISEPGSTGKNPEVIAVHFNTERSYHRGKELRDA